MKNVRCSKHLARHYRSENIDLAFRLPISVRSPSIRARPSVWSESRLTALKEACRPIKIHRCWREKERSEKQVGGRSRKLFKLLGPDIRIWSRSPKAQSQH